MNALTDGPGFGDHATSYFRTEDPAAGRSEQMIKDGDQYQPDDWL
jgi:hypothetical protein